MEELAAMTVVDRWRGRRNCTINNRETDNIRFWAISRPAVDSPTKPTYAFGKLPAQQNETETKQFWNCFVSVSFRCLGYQIECIVYSTGWPKNLSQYQIIKKSC